MIRWGDLRGSGRGLDTSDAGGDGHRLRRLLQAGPERVELEAVARESDAELRCEALLGLARRQEAAGRLDAAAELYAAVIQEADAVGAGQVQPLRARAQEHLDAILGRGAAGPRAEFLLRNLARQSSDPTMLFAMGAAGAVFRVTRLATLSRLVSTPHPGILTQLIGAGRLASLTGFALEAPAFTLAARLGSEALGRQQDWSGAALGRDIASSYLVLGGLKLAGWGSGAAYRRIAAPVGTVRAGSLQTLFQQGGMLAGILLGHSLEERLGLRPRVDGATTLTDSLATLLQFNVAGRLTRQAFGPRFAAWERGLDLQSEALSQGAWGARLSPPGFGLGVPTFGRIPIPAAAGAPGSRGAARSPERPTLLFMTGKGRGGGSWQQELQAAARLRLELTPAEAWRRRAERAAEYVGRLKSLPTARRETLEEVQQGLELLGAWARGGDGFRKAIGYRHYAELWRLLADGWNPASLNAAMTEMFRNHLDRHRDLLGVERNPRFLRSALEATPQLGRIYSHSQGALIEGSPRERDLGSALESLLAVVRLGAAAPATAELRPKYLEAFHDTLNNSVGGRLGLAREAHAGIRLAREWMTGADPELRPLGLRYFPEFWRLLAERANPGFKEAMLEALQQEIVFLQQHTRPHGVPHETLVAALKAFPYYADTVFQSVGPAPGNTFMLVQTFLAQARTLRPWIAEHADPQVRAECARSYLKLMAGVQSRAADILEFERLFPVSPNREVVVELEAALRLFTSRLATQEASELLPALRDYQELAMLLPPRADLARDLLSETNLKPLMRLQYHPDPRVRPAVEELLVKLVHRFSGAASGGGSSN